MTTSISVEMPEIPAILTTNAIQEALKGLDGWCYDASDYYITKQYRFSNYQQSFAFVTLVSMMAERANHHPDIRFGWGYAEITLTTHDAGGVTQRDIALAGMIEKADSVPNKKGN